MPMDNRLLVPRYKYDPDAAVYLAAVEAADGQALETPVKRAIDTFIKALKADGLWSSIGSSCLLCGPRTLAGALVPLRGDAPTAYGFVEGDYFRDTGLKGDASSYLDSNRANSADLQDDCHLAAYLTAPTVANAKYLLGAQNSTDPSYNVIGDGLYSRTLDTPGGKPTLRSPVPIGFTGISRSQSDRYDYVKPPDSVAEHVADSFADDIGNTHFVFAYQHADGSAVATTDATIAFYSIGSSVDLAKLDTHVSACVTAIGAAL